MNIGISWPILKIMEVINTFITFFQTYFSQMNDLSLEVKLHYFCMISRITLRTYNFVR